MYAQNTDGAWFSKHLALDDYHDWKDGLIPELTKHEVFELGKKAGLDTLVILKDIARYFPKES